MKGKQEYETGEENTTRIEEGTSIIGWVVV